MMVPDYQAESRLAYKERMQGLLTIDPRTTVVVTVDLQRNYLDMDVAWSPVAADDAERVVSSAKLVLDCARASGIPVIHAYVRRRKIEAERGMDIAQAKRLKDLQDGKPMDRVEGTPQAEIPASLVEQSDVHVTTKKAMDAFLYTDLDLLLQKAFQTETVVLMGINTDTCVYATAFGANNRGYKPIVISDCVASGRGKDQHWMALELMARSFVWVMSKEEIIEKMEARSIVGAGASGHR
jgi:biuret amidohydrolase